MGKADRDTSQMVGKRIKLARRLMGAKQFHFCDFDERDIRRYEEGKIPPKRFPRFAEGLGISLPELLDRDDDRFMETLAGAIEKLKGEKLPPEKIIHEAIAVLDYGGRQKKAILDHIRDSCGSFEIIVPYTGSMEKHFRHTPLLLQVPRRELARRGSEQEQVDLRSMDICQWEEAVQEKSSTFAEVPLRDLFTGYRKILTKANLVGEGVIDVPRFVLLGPPGSGKTTLTRYLAWSCAAGSPEVRYRDLVPALVRLPEWETSTIPDLASFLAMHYGKEICDREWECPSEKHWNLWLERGEVLLLLDGLDEIKNVPEFRKLLPPLLRKLRSCPTILTCRTVSFDRYETLCSGLPLFTLGGLQQREQEEYIRAFPARNKNRFASAGLIEQLKSLPQLRPLAANPLLLSLICYVADHGQSGFKLPTTRGELYDLAVDNLLKAVDEKSTSSDRSKWVNLRYPGTILTSQKRGALERAALVLFGSSEGRRLFFDERSLVDALTTGVDAQALADAGSVASNLVEDLTKNSGILRTGSLGRYFFLHLTLQEFLAGCALADVVKSNGWQAGIRFGDRTLTPRDIIECKSWDPDWQETIAFFAGRLEDPTPLLDNLADEKRDDCFRHRLALAAFCLPELKPRIRDSYAPGIDHICTLAWCCWIQTRSEYGKEFGKYARRMLYPLWLINGRIEGLSIQEYFRRGFLNDDADRWSEVEELIETIGSAAATGPFLNELVGLLKNDSLELRCRALTVVRLLGRAAAEHPEVMAGLAQMLLSTSEQERLGALCAIDAIGKTALDYPDIVTGLSELLQSKDREVRIDAASSIEEIGSASAEHPGIMARVAEMLFSENDEEQRTAAAVVEAIGSDAAEHDGIMAGLAKMLYTKDGAGLTEWASLRAIEAVGSAAAQCREFMNALIDLFHSEKEEEQKRGASAVRAIGGPAAKYSEIMTSLVEMLQSTDTEKKLYALRAIEAIGTAAADHEEITAGLVEMSRSKDLMVRWIADLAIRAMKSLVTDHRDVMPGLGELFRSGNHREIWKVLRAIDASRSAASEHPEIMCSLIPMLRSDDSLEIVEAILIIEDMGSLAAEHQEFMTGLAEMLHSKTERGRAASIVGSIGSAAAAYRGIISGLAEIFRSKDNSKPDSAISAIESMGRSAAEHQAIMAALMDVLHYDNGKWSETTKRIIAALVSQGIRIFQVTRGKYIVRSVSELAQCTHSGFNKA